MLKLIQIALFTLFASFSQAQSFFDKYQLLESKGPIPADFTTSTLQKIQHDDVSGLTHVSKKQRQYFVEQVNYNIDEILRSGEVTFGDTITTYLQQIGGRLMKYKPELASKIRFYCYNTPRANAFSTSQGIIFVSTGLLAQFTSEAQLAFVLAHEIVHYDKHHVFDYYKFAQKNRFASRKERLRLLSNYSRENEAEADKLAIEMMYVAGYNPSEISLAFDVLLYSNLPFEEIPFSTQYLASKQLYIPQSFSKIKPKSIAISSSENDYLASHPNIDKRKSVTENMIQKYSDWKLTKSFDENYFELVRDVARFEYVRKKVYLNEPVEALYAIYILEKKFPHSSFLNEMKAQSWLNLMKITDLHARLNRAQTKWISQKVNVKQAYQGQISILDQFLNSISSTAKLTLGLRQITDILQTNSTSPLLNKLWDEAVKLVAQSYIFPFPSFSTNNYLDALNLKTSNQVDSLKTNQIDSVGDKYTVIKNQTSGKSFNHQIDSTKFYLFGLSDLKKDSTFNRLFNHYNALKNQQEEAIEAFNRLTDTEQSMQLKEKSKQDLYLGLDSLLIISPAVFDTKFNLSINVIKTLKTEFKLKSAIVESAQSLGLTTNFLDNQNKLTMTTDRLNDIAFLNESISRAILDKGADAFVVDLEKLNQISNKYGISKMLYIEFQHSYKPNFTVANVTLYSILLPVGLFYFPIELLSAHHSDWQFYLVDLKTGEVIVDRAYFANEPATKNALGSRVYNMIHEFKTKPNE